jgi:hypothetical protein
MQIFFHPSLHAVFFLTFRRKCMNMKLLGAAVAAALLGLSTVSFGQASGQDTPREAAAAKEGPGSAISGTTSSTSGSATTSAPATKENCDTLSGSAKTRCLGEPGASGGSSTTAPAGSVTKLPDQSGPGTSDKTDSKSPQAPGVGTSSAGSQ